MYGQRSERASTIRTPVDPACSMTPSMHATYALPCMLMHAYLQVQQSSQSASWSGEDLANATG
jgi:hypothetical protein